MKKYLLLFIVFIPISLFAQQSARIANLMETYSSKKGVTYVEMAKPMLNSILCRRNNSNTLTVAERAKLAPCSVPDVFKSLSLKADAECMKAFREVAAKEKFSVLKRNANEKAEVYYYTKVYGDNRSEVLILMYTEYHEDFIRMYENVNTPSLSPPTYSPSKMSIVYVAGAIDVTQADEYLSRILESLRLEAHMVETRRALLVANDLEKPISLDDVGVDELNKLTENYQQAISQLEKSNLSSKDKAVRQGLIDKLRSEIYRFQVKLVELKGGRISTSSYSLYRAPSTSTTTITPNSDQP